MREALLLLSVSMSCALAAACGPECRGLYDCPDSMRCSAGGACVAMADREDRGDLWSGERWPTDGLFSVDTAQSRVVGRVGRQVNVNAVPTEVSLDSGGGFVTAPGGGARTVIFFYAIDPAAWMAALNEPGSRSLPEDVAVSVTCTTEESPGIEHYDEQAAELQVTVEDDGVAEITVRAPGATDVVVRTVPSR
jgi:hypothetical protein